jgi:hypothetical protein
MTVADAVFEAGEGDDALTWAVSAAGVNGEIVRLGYEPYSGRLVKIVRGGAQSGASCSSLCS